MGIIDPEAREGQKVYSYFDGNNITGYLPYMVAKAGIGYSPEERRIFPNLSVMENLILGLKGGKIEKGDPDVWTVDRIFHHFFLLKERADHKGRWPSLW